jgi:hypothetical protein
MRGDEIPRRMCLPGWQKHSRRGLRTVMNRRSPRAAPPVLRHGDDDLAAVTSAPAATIVLCAGSLVREAFS